MGATMRLLRFLLVEVCIGLAMTGLAAGQNIDQVTEGNHVLLRDPVVVRAIPSRVLAHLGNQRVGQGIRAKLSLKNSTGSSWNVRYLDPDCGCLDVVPAQRKVQAGGMLDLSVQLAPSNKVANIRRSIRIYFYGSDSPVVLDVDVRLRGPLGLLHRTIQLDSSDAPFMVSGTVHEMVDRVQRVESARGTFVTTGSLKQTADTFCFSATPTFSFGNAEDLLRVHYRERSGLDRVVDIPLLLTFNDPVRFLPSILHLNQEEGKWVGSVRMIAMPGKLKTPLEELKFEFDFASQRLLTPAHAAFRVNASSSIISKLEVEIGQVKNEKWQNAQASQTSMPSRLIVRGDNEQIIGVLKLVCKGEDR